MYEGHDANAELSRIMGTIIGLEGVPLESPTGWLGENGEAQETGGDTRDAGKSGTERGKCRSPGTQTWGWRVQVRA